MIATVKTPFNLAAAFRGLLRRGIESVFEVGRCRCIRTRFPVCMDQKYQTQLHAGIMLWTPSATREGVFDRLICAATRDHAAFHTDDLTFLCGSDDPLLTFTERTAIKVTFA